MWMTVQHRRTPNWPSGGLGSQSSRTLQTSFPATARRRRSSLPTCILMALRRHHPLQPSVFGAAVCCAPFRVFRILLLCICMQRPIQKIAAQIDVRPSGIPGSMGEVICTGHYIAACVPSRAVERKYAADALASSLQSVSLASSLEARPGAALRRRRRLRDSRHVRRRVPYDGTRLSGWYRCCGPLSESSVPQSYRIRGTVANRLADNKLL